MATMALTAETPQHTGLKPCRLCGAKLQRALVDLGFPLCETHPTASDFAEPLTACVGRSEDAPNPNEN